jgi:hypothetical protein
MVRRRRWWGLGRKRAHRTCRAAETEPGDEAEATHSMNLFLFTICFTCRAALRSILLLEISGVAGGAGRWECGAAGEGERSAERDAGTLALCVM